MYNDTCYFTLKRGTPMRTRGITSFVWNDSLQGGKWLVRIISAIYEWNLTPSVGPFDPFKELFDTWVIISLKVSYDFLFFFQCTFIDTSHEDWPSVPNMYSSWSASSCRVTNGGEIFSTAKNATKFPEYVAMMITKNMNQHPSRILLGMVVGWRGCPGRFYIQWVYLRYCHVNMVVNAWW